MSAAAGKNVIDSLFIALGFVSDSSGLDEFKRKAEEATGTLLKVGGLVTGALAGIAVKAIAQIGDEFEQNTIAIAGFFDALGVSSDFNAGMELADATMNQIIRDAAALPGEAEEYIEVFRAGLPVLKDAVPDFSVEKITDFTNHLSAIAHTLKIPYEVTSREMQELFIKGEGHATRINILFKRFLPLLRRVEGFQGIDAKKFNQMTAPQRVKLFQDAFAKVQPMLDRSANSFDAMKGAVISAVKMLTRLGTSTIFEGMKKALMKVNATFFTAAGRLTDTGKAVVELGGKISRMFVQAISSTVALASALAHSSVAMTMVKTIAVLLGIALAGLAFEKVAGGVGMLLYSLMNLKRLLTGGIFAAIALVAEDLYVFETGGDSVTGMLVDRFGPAVEYIVGSVLGGLVLALVYVNRQAVMMGVNLARAALGPLAPLLLLAAGIYGVVKLWGKFGEKGHAAMVFVGSAAAALFLYLKRGAIQTAIGIALMNLPLILIIGTLAALAAGIYYVVTRWDTFGAGAKTAIVAVATVLGVLIAAFVATQGAAIAAGVASAAAWVAAGAPVVLLILGVGLLGVALYELVHHWEQVTNAIWDAVDAAGRFFHLSNDASGRKDLAARRAKSDAALGGLGGGAFDTKKRLRSAGNDGESTDFLTKKKPGGASGAAPAAAGGFDPTAMVKGLLGGGGVPDIGALLGMGGAQPAGAGGAPAGMLPPWMTDMLAKGSGGGTTTINNHHDLKVGDVRVDARGNDNADEIARKVEDARARQIRNIQGPETGGG